GTGQAARKAAVRVWCLGAARHLLQDENAYLMNSPDGPAPADLLSTWRAAASAVTHAHVKSYKRPPPKELVEENRAQADLLREVLGDPFRPPDGVAEDLAEEVGL